ncbi:hypothetical protein TWF694_001140 [Orbilia ellipsospora]|uniref:Uncharacterized protein n=1 Tax=Orbilia ellipsospora TaxID=2528407 RepID=A0AAV9XQS5_9PEZI
MCNQLTWGVFPTSSSGAGTGSTTSNTSPSPAISSSLSSPFVLEGDGPFQNYLFEFDDDSGRVLLGATGQETLVSFQLTDGVLQNTADTSQLVYLRYNSTVAETFQTEGQAVANIIREVRFGAEDSLIASDYSDGWVWNSMNAQLSLNYQDETWSFVASHPAAELLLDRKLSTLKVKSVLPIYIYMLPNTIELLANSLLQRVSVVSQNPQQFSSFLSTATSPSLPSTTSRSSSLLSSSPNSPSPSSYYSSPSSLPSSSSSLSPSSLSPSSSSLSPSFSPSSSSYSSSALTVTLDPYDVITSNGLQDYCITLLSYFSPSAVLINTIHTATSRFTDGNLAPTDVTTSTSTFVTTVTSTTSILTSVPASASSSLAERDIQHAGFGKRGVRNLQQLHDTSGYITNLERRAPPCELSIYSSAALSSACSRAVTSPLSTFTSANLIYDLLISSIPPVSTSLTTSTSTSVSLSTVYGSTNYLAIGYLTTARG